MCVHAAVGCRDFIGIRKYSKIFKLYLFDFLLVVEVEAVNPSSVPIKLARSQLAVRDCFILFYTKTFCRKHHSRPGVDLSKCSFRISYVS